MKKWTEREREIVLDGLNARQRELMRARGKLGPDEEVLFSHYSFLALEVEDVIIKFKGGKW